MNQSKLLIFAGSARKESLNKKLALSAAKYAAESGAATTVIDLKDFPMPIYNGDLEAESGLPDKAREFKKLLIEHDGFLIASPEYNGSVSPLLKNAIDWASRHEEGDASQLVAYQNKTAALVATSPGAGGGLRGLAILRALLSGIGVLVMPKQYALPHGNKAFNEEGDLIDESTQNHLSLVARQLAQTTAKLIS